MLGSGPALRVRVVSELVVHPKDGPENRMEGGLGFGGFVSPSAELSLEFLGLVKELFETTLVCVVLHDQCRSLSFQVLDLGLDGCDASSHGFDAGFEVTGFLFDRGLALEQAALVGLEADMDLF
jgi:hypothetical protein